MSFGLACVIAWGALNLLAVAAGIRLERTRRRNERPAVDIRHERPASEGYASLLLTRLVVHARRVLDVDQAILMVRERRRPGRLIVVAAHGTDEDLVGSAVPIRGVLQRVVSDRPLRHGPLGEIVPDAGEAPAITAAALGGSGELAVLCAASLDSERSFTRVQLELLEDMAGTCAAAISDAALGTRLEPTMRVFMDELTAVPEPSLAARAGVALGLDDCALAELDMAARACTMAGVKLNALDDGRSRRFRRAPSTHVVERLVDAPGLEAVGIVVRFLAERWDGAGPYGLCREQIPLASRVLSASLAFDEAVAGGSTSSETALRRLKHQRGTAFDPVVVDAIAFARGSSGTPLEAETWASADAQFEAPLLAAAA